MIHQVDTFLKETTNVLIDQHKNVDVFLPISLDQADYQVVVTDQGSIDLKKLYSLCILKAAQTYQKGQHGTEIYTSQTKEYKRRTEKAFKQFLTVNPETGNEQYLCIVLVKPEGQSKIHGQNKRSLGLTPTMLRNLANKFHGIILDNRFPGMKQIQNNEVC